MCAVDVVGRLSSFVRSIKQTAIFRVSQQQLSQLSASASDSNVEWCVSFLSEERKIKESSKSLHYINNSKTVMFSQDSLVWASVICNTLSTADTLAPLSSSSSTISMFLIFVALMSGVSPSLNRNIYTLFLRL